MKIVFWNVENLFLPHCDPGPLKSQKNIESLAQQIHYMDPDILFLAEVGGLLALETFNLNFLQNKYRILFTPGNSNRNIQLACLIKSEFESKSSHLSYAKSLLGQSPDGRDLYFARDLGHLILKDEDREKPLHLWWVHLKSQLTVAADDHRGIIHREHEIKFICQKINEYQDDQHILMGDFNGLAFHEFPDREFRPLMELPLSCLYEKLDVEPQFSWLGFDRAKKFTPLMLDYAFLSEDLFDFLDKKESGLFHPLNEDGKPLSWPKHPRDRVNFPADHLPLVIKLKASR